MIRIIASAAAVLLLGAAPIPRVYILAGQSNMSGRGVMDELSQDDWVPDARIRLYGNDGQWRTALDPLDDAHGQIDAISTDKQAGVGPGLFFARASLKLDPNPIALLTCAKGRTSIDQWTSSAERTTLYGSCLARVREVGGRPRGMLWYQGESDAQKSPADAVRWAAKFEEMARTFRADLNMADLPIVIVQLADHPRSNAARYPAWDVIQAQQSRPPLPCTATVSAKGLPRNPDDLHLTTAAQRKLGPKLAKATAKLIKQRCGFSE